MTDIERRKSQELKLRAWLSALTTQTTKLPHVRFSFGNNKNFQLNVSESTLPCLGYDKQGHETLTPDVHWLGILKSAQRTTCKALDTKLTKISDRNNACIHRSIFKLNFPPNSSS